MMARKLLQFYFLGFYLSLTPLPSKPSLPTWLLGFFNITKCFHRVICICQDNGLGVMNYKVDILVYTGIEKPNPESKAEEWRCSVLHYLSSLTLLFLPCPVFPYILAFAFREGFFFHFMIKPQQIGCSDRSACII